MTINYKFVIYAHPLEDNATPVQITMEESLSPLIARERAFLAFEEATKEVLTFPNFFDYQIIVEARDQNDLIVESHVVAGFFMEQTSAGLIKEMQCYERNLPNYPVRSIKFNNALRRHDRHNTRGWKDCIEYHGLNVSAPIINHNLDELIGCQIQRQNEYLIRFRIEKQ